MPAHISTREVYRFEESRFTRFIFPDDDVQSWIAFQSELLEELEILDVDALYHAAGST